MRQNIIDYLLVGIEDDFGQFSGKRALGTLCIITGLVLTSIISFNCQDKLAEQTMLIAPVFATGLMFWGLTSYQTLQTNKQVINNSISEQVINKDGDSSQININQTQ
jgi:hypothetical protein